MKKIFVCITAVIVLAVLVMNAVAAGVVEIPAVEEPVGNTETVAEIPTEEAQETVEKVIEPDVVEVVEERVEEPTSLVEKAEEIKERETLRDDAPEFEGEFVPVIEPVITDAPKYTETKKVPGVYIPSDIETPEL